ncbi:PilZ domain-containing protein [Bradyrhizobium sp. SZCCHNRI20481]|uniref:PilZ domain-containing protein n=1 Tax=Bradyrhizobium sp. SZCCHNRI20481 TaxID=3057286 RepID=UPI002915C5AC|nr:PilZ domain-containing protein [Bradyrhizobium sp. SZCCHNRI20481]
MQNRRREARQRVYYGGVLTFNSGCSTLACVVRNFNHRGVKVELEGSVLLPDRVEISIERRGWTRPAQMVWRDGAGAGLAFHHDDGEVIDLETARALRLQERANRQLKSRLEQLLSGH